MGRKGGGRRRGEEGERGRGWDGERRGGGEREGPVLSSLSLLPRPAAPSGDSSPPPPAAAAESDSPASAAGPGRQAPAEGRADR